MALGEFLRAIFAQNHMITIYSGRCKSLDGACRDLKQQARVAGCWLPRGIDICKHYDIEVRIAIPHPSEHWRMVCTDPQPNYELAKNDLIAKCPWYNRQFLFSRAGPQFLVEVRTAFLQGQQEKLKSVWSGLDYHTLSPEIPAKFHN